MCQSKFRQIPKPKYIHVLEVQEVIRVQVLVQDVLSIRSDNLAIQGLQAVLSVVNNIINYASTNNASTNTDGTDADAVSDDSADAVSDDSADDSPGGADSSGPYSTGTDGTTDSSAETESGSESGPETPDNSQAE